MECVNISYLRARDPSILACGYATRNVKTNLADQLVEKITNTNNETSTNEDHLQVYLRLKNIENFEDLYCINGNSLLCKVPEGAQCIRNVRDGTTVTKKFKFSKIFPPDSKQTDLFNNIVKEKVLKFINGFNCSLLAYGASGSGKTYTIVGTADQPGIIPRALEYLFRTLPQLPEEPQIKPADSGKIIRLSSSAKKLEKTAIHTLLNNSTIIVHHTQTYKTMQQCLSNEPVAIISDDISDVSLGVWVSFAEIYNEHVYDLLTPQPPRGQSRQILHLGHYNGNTYIKSLRHINVTSGLQAYHLLQYGLKSRKFAATCINEHSSRSHSIFTIKLAQASNTKEGVTVSSFNFCDLAGSERLNKTHNVGDRLKESNNINTSLLVLGRCVSSIRDAQKSQNQNKLIPFRESKLTQVFQRALLGHEAISMIVNVNPTRQMFDESQHVLNFSAIAKDVTVEQQQLIERPRNNRFSQYIEATSTSFSTIGEETENAQVEELQTLIANLVEQIQQEQLDAKEDREYTIAEYKKLLEETNKFWEDRHQELEDQLANQKKSVIDNVQKQESKKRKLSVIVLDSSSEEDEKLTKSELKNYKMHKLNSKKNFVICQKELTELKLQFQTGETQIQKLTEENKLIEKTLKDAAKAYKDLELQYETKHKELTAKLLQQQDEIDVLTAYQDQLLLSGISDDKEVNDAPSLPLSDNSKENQLSVGLHELVQHTQEETPL